MPQQFKPTPLIVAVAVVVVIVPLCVIFVPRPANEPKRDSSTAVPEEKAVVYESRIPTDPKPKAKKQPTPVKVPEMLPPPPEAPAPMMVVIEPIKEIPLPGKLQPIEEIPVPGKPLRQVVLGYETRQIQGFTVMLSTHAVREAKKEYGKPFEAIKAEFDRMVEVLPPATLPHLRRILIWIEWDNIDEKGPDSIAKYYTESVWELPPNEIALKANSIEVRSLKKLSEEKIQSSERPRLVLLHQLAHVVHHHVVGIENPEVLFAYKQAVDRKLYEKVEDDDGEEVRAYAATSALEYFAELTCAYLDRCPYYPFVRD